jgi:hypothetical protein
MAYEKRCQEMLRIETNFSPTNEAIKLTPLLKALELIQALKNESGITKEAI